MRLANKGPRDRGTKRLTKGSGDNLRDQETN